ncbi:TPA: phage tail protein [Acinetobacter baumannii]|uniref:phage tail protein n=1 Tax=Acinetobacter baumannii TaxID=470 RepID=UPI00215FF9CA|nr:phage tail protein [Acinetobacter baumannii]
MSISANIKVPDVYTSVNINTQRTGLPLNDQRVLFVTLDVLSEQFTPVDIYDKADADAKFGANSQAGRMITAAVKTNRTVSVQAVVLAVEGVQTQAALLAEDNNPVLAEDGVLIEP